MSLSKQMLTFLTVVQQQSFTRAAEKLFLTTTAVSKQVKELENKMGAQLLTRNTRNVKVTYLGTQFYEYCLRLQTELIHAKSFIESQQQEPQGEIRILSSHYFANAYLIENLGKFYKSFPRLLLNIEVNDLHPEINENFDVIAGFRYTHMVNDSMRQRKLHEASYILCASPDYIKHHGAPDVPQDLMQHQLLSHPERKPNNLIRFRNDVEIFMPEPHILINNLYLLLQLCLQGTGIVMLAEQEAINWLNTGDLIKILPNHPLENFMIYAFYQSTAYEQRKINCFLDFFTDKSNFSH